MTMPNVKKHFRLSYKIIKVMSSHSSSFSSNLFLFSWTRTFTRETVSLEIKFLEKIENWVYMNFYGKGPKHK